MQKPCRPVAEGITHPDPTHTLTHTRAHTHAKIIAQDALAKQGGRLIYSGQTCEKSLSCR